MELPNSKRLPCTNRSCSLWKPEVQRTACNAWGADGAFGIDALIRQAPLNGRLDEPGACPFEELVIKPIVRRVTGRLSGDGSWDRHDMFADIMLKLFAIDDVMRARIDRSSHLFTFFWGKLYDKARGIWGRRRCTQCQHYQPMPGAGGKCMLATTSENEPNVHFGVRLPTHAAPTELDPPCGDYLRRPRSTSRELDTAQPDNKERPEEEVMRTEEQQLVRRGVLRVLAEMPLEGRIFHQNHYEGVSQHALAKMYGLTRDCVRTMLERARARLKQILIDDGLMDDGEQS